VDALHGLVIVALIVALVVEIAASVLADKRRN
jgi:hypothetical protein